MTEEQGHTTNSGDQWVLALVNEARNNYPLVSDDVFSAMELLLKGQLSERDLTPSGLKEIATQLIRDMVSIAPKPEETK